jgi:hypothetical protein
MKATSAFKLDRTTKRILSLTANKETRNQIKKLMIDAQLTYEETQKRNFRKEKNTEE